LDVWLGSVSSLILLNDVRLIEVQSTTDVEAVVLTQKMAKTRGVISLTITNGWMGADVKMSVADAFETEMEPGPEAEHSDNK
jgi:hypothetical protein